jgi:hypothetical protein
MTEQGSTGGTVPEFETFSRRMVSLQADPFVTVQRRGSMSLNQSALAALGTPDAVELLYDRDASIIGLRAVDPRSDTAYQVRRASRSTTGPWVISAMAFTKYYGIDTSATRRWPAYLDDNVLCVELRGNAGDDADESRTG